MTKCDPAVVDRGCIQFTVCHSFAGLQLSRIMMVPWLVNASCAVDLPSKRECSEITSLFVGLTGSRILGGPKLTKAAEAVLCCCDGTLNEPHGASVLGAGLQLSRIFGCAPRGVQERGGALCAPRRFCNGACTINKMKRWPTCEAAAYIPTVRPTLRATQKNHFPKISQPHRPSHTHRDRTPGDTEAIAPRPGDAHKPTQTAITPHRRKTKHDLCALMTRACRRGG